MWFVLEDVFDHVRGVVFFLLVIKRVTSKILCIAK